MRFLKIHLFKKRSENEEVEEFSAETDVSEDIAAPSPQENFVKFDVAAVWVMIIGAFLLPLFFLPFAQTQVEFWKTLFLGTIIAITLFLWLIARLKTGVFVIPRHFLLISGFLIFTAFLLSAFFSPSFTTAFEGVAFDVGTVMFALFLFLFMYLAAVLFRSQKQIYYLYSAFFLSFAAVFLFHAVRIFGGVDVFSFGIFTSSASSIVGKWNDVGVFAGAIALFAFLALEFAPLSRALRSTAHIFLWLSLVSLTIINFSLLWVILGTIALIVLIYNLSLNKSSLGFEKSGQGFSLPPVILVLVSSLFIVFGPSWGASISEYTGISYLEVRPSWESTFAITEKTWEEHPIFGSGPNLFEIQWAAYKPEAVNSTLFWNTNFTGGIGLLPTFAITTGILGTLSWILFLGIFLYSGVRSLFIVADPPTRYLTISAFIGGGYFLAVAIFYMPNSVLLGLAFLLFGVYVALLAQQGVIKNSVFFAARDPRVGFVSVLILIALLMTVVLGGYMLYERYQTVIYVSKGQTAFTEGDFNTARGYISRAIALHETDKFYRLLIEIELARLNEILTQQGTSVEVIREEFQRTLGNAIAAGQSAVRIGEMNYQNWISLGRVYEAVVPLNISGAYENARVSFERAATLYPKNPEIQLRHARLEIARGSGENAREYIAGALALKENYADAALLLAQIEINEGNVRGAIRSLEQVSLINPNNVSVFFQLGVLNYSIEDYQKAIAALERAISLSPDYANAKYYLGISYHSVGESARAIAQFEDIAALNPNNEEVPKILENLREGMDPFDGILSPGSSPLRDEAPVAE